MKELEVTCPNCKKKFNYYSSDFRPFCSEICRQIDLGMWLTESYTLPAQNLSLEEMEKIEEIYDEEDSDEE